ncbi:hypothetical protein [Dysgonomonas capnocytophagoides]|uniref:hypothetical protein n=1 Tax=Dysgonomonas capnocytophagoides TaxID=45254 RepID=UPI00333FFB86
MKKLILTFALILTCSAYTMQAQRVSVNINIGSQPAWGPVGYDYVDYYYMPDIDCYYSVNQGLFFYLNAGRWVGVRYLPYAYRNYDFYTMYKVVLVGHDPWMYNNRHRREYARYRGYRTQPVIRYSRDVRYRNSRNNDVIWYDRRSNDRHDNRHDNRYDRGRSDNGRYSSGRYDNKRDDSRYTNGRTNRVDNNRNENKRSSGTRESSKSDSRSSRSGQSSGSYYTQTSSRSGDRTSNNSRSSSESSRSGSSRSDRR